MLLQQGRGSPQAAWRLLCQKQELIHRLASTAYALDMHTSLCTPHQPESACSTTAASRGIQVLRPDSGLGNISFLLAVLLRQCQLRPAPVVYCQSNTTHCHVTAGEMGCL